MSVHDGRASKVLAALLAAAGALVVLAPGEASAFCRSTTCRSTGDSDCGKDDDGCPTKGARLFWPSSCISYACNEVGTQFLDPVDTRAAIKKTFQAWTDVKCPDGRTASMAFQEREPVSCKKSEYNKEKPNLNVVLFQDDDWRYRGIDGTLAKTSVTYNDETGEIYDADIEVNTAFNKITLSDTRPEYDLQAILTHEVGHFIGVAHSADSTAVMYASYSPGSLAQRQLSPDDIDAVCAIYPPESGVACLVEPRNGFSAECDEPVVTSCAVSADRQAGAGAGTGTSAGLTGPLAALGLSVLVTRWRSARSAAASSRSGRGT